MTETETFPVFRSIPRFFRDIVVTEKIDGTNALVHVGEDGTVRAGSRTRWITQDADNFGFAAWVAVHADELRGLGPGLHYGEWYGAGIQRSYGLSERRFALFNVTRWEDASVRPACCACVPVLYRGAFSEGAVRDALASLASGGSVAVPGFAKPEGVVVYHESSNGLFKVTLDKNDGHKSK